MKKMLTGAFCLTLALVLSGCSTEKSTQEGSKQNSPSKTNSNETSKPTASTNTPASEKNYVISDGDIVLFWGEGCPHCANVEKFLTDNKELADKLKIRQFEVYGDKEAQKLFVAKAKECGLSSLGVPTLYRDGKCSQGDVPIIEELKK